MRDGKWAIVVDMKELSMTVSTNGQDKGHVVTIVKINGTMIARPNIPARMSRSAIKPSIRVAV